MGFTLKLIVLFGICLRVVFGKEPLIGDAVFYPRRIRIAFGMTPDFLCGIRAGSSSLPDIIDEWSNSSSSEYDLDCLEEDFIRTSSLGGVRYGGDEDEEDNHGDDENGMDVPSISECESLYDSDDIGQEYRQDYTGIVQPDFTGDNLFDENILKLSKSDPELGEKYTEVNSDKISDNHREMSAPQTREYDEFGDETFDSYQNIESDYDQIEIFEELKEGSTKLQDQFKSESLGGSDSEQIGVTQDVSSEVATYAAEMLSPESIDDCNDESHSSTSVLVDVPYEETGSTTTELLDDDESCIDRLDEADAYDDILDPNQNINDQSTCPTSVTNIGEKINHVDNELETHHGVKSIEDVVIGEDKRSEEPYLLESFISQIPSKQDKSVNFIITRRMRKMLVNELGYSVIDVATMRPGVAALVIEKGVHCPTFGMPQEWKDKSFIQSRKFQPSILKKYLVPALTLALSSLVLGSLRSSESPSIINPVERVIDSTELNIEERALESLENEVNEKNKNVPDDVFAHHQFQDLDETWLDKLITNILDRVPVSKAENLR